MKTLFLYRYGHYKRFDVSEIIKRNTINVPLFIKNHENFLTIFHTENSLKNIGNQLSELQPPIAYFLIEITLENIDFHFPSEIGLQILNFITTHKKRDLQKELNEALKIEDYLKAAELQNQINNQNKINQ